jgi:hypothetical protein
VEKLLILNAVFTPQFTWRREKNKFNDCQE